VVATPSATTATSSALHVLIVRMWVLRLGDFA
jgi:hypothetical protein